MTKKLLVKPIGWTRVSGADGKEIDVFRIPAGARVKGTMPNGTQIDLVAREDFIIADYEDVEAMQAVYEAMRSSKKPN
jgi:hypothetical protein